MDTESTCVELALEGERLCKTGDFFRGVQYFEAAVHMGTDNIPTLGALYSQLGNAYYILEDFGKSLEYHRLDLNLMRASGDRLGEAKASGNIGNTLKALGKFDEAMAFCRRHQDIARELGEKATEAKAFYNLGNVCYARGKTLGLPALYDPGEYPADCNNLFEEGAKYYEENVAVLKELSDRHGLGRTYGNLGNTYYVLGNFTKAIQCHEERLLISKEFGDVLSERRAYTNLGNAYMFLGEFSVAADYFKYASLLN